MRRSLIVTGLAGIAVIIALALAFVFRRLRRLRDHASQAGRPGAAVAAPADGPPAAVDERIHPPTAQSPLIAAPRFSAVALVAIPVATLTGGVFFFTVWAPWLSEQTDFPPPPEQPIYFSHDVHTELAGLDCAFCHRTADRAPTAGFPDVEQCMFCHIVVDDIQQATERSAYEGQIAKLRSAWSEGEPVAWARVHRLPDHSRFPHDAHVQANVPCATCHGDVAQMDVVKQARSLKMADCVECHQETSAPTDCVDCHH